MKQIEYTYRDLLKMALMLGRMVVRPDRRNDRSIGLLLPNLAPTLALIGLTAHRRRMLNYTAGVDGMQAAAHGRTSALS